MKLGLLLRIAAIYMGVVGIGLILVPGAFGTGAVPEDASQELLAFIRLWGAPLLGIALLDWLARDAEPSKTRDAIVYGNLVGFAAIAAIDIWGSFLGHARPITKLFAVVHTLFALAFFLAARTYRSDRPA